MKKAIFICFISFAFFCSVYAANAVAPDAGLQTTNKTLSKTELPVTSATEKPLDSQSGGITKPKIPDATLPVTEKNNSTKNESQSSADSANVAANSATSTTSVPVTEPTVKPTTPLNNNNQTVVTNSTIPNQSNKPTNNTTDNIPKKPEEKPIEQPVQARGFDGASFVGGIILTLGLLAIGFMGYKYYKTQTERNYHTL